MRAQVRLLQLLVNYWDPETESFNLDGKPLRIEVDDIYFITGLSHRGEVVNLKARGAGGGMTMEEYISTHCVAGTDKVGSQLPIRVIENLSLKIIVLVLTWILGSASLHQASRPLMFYAVECLRPIVYDWCTSLLANMKSQLMDCKQGKMRNFGFASILCSFFFERVPGLSPRVEITPHGQRDPTMSWWTDVMRWLGGGRVPTPYNDEFFFWWR
jgi:hypothetical protein